MSVKNVKAFYEKVEEDKGLQAKLKALHANAQSQMAATTAELIKIAADAGFQFTPADLAATRKEAINKLTLDELKKKDMFPDALDCMPGWKIVG